MSQAKITLIGLENYLNPEQSVFDFMSLPAGIDRDVLISSILLRCQEFELLYSDPEFMISAVKVWSLKNYHTFNKWVTALNIQYDPLYNYDRTEEYTDTHVGSFNRAGSDSGTNGNTRTDNLTMTNNLTDTNDVTLTYSEKAYDEAAFVEKDKDVTDQDQTHTGTVTNTGTVSDSGNYNSSNTDTGSDTHTNTHTARLYGNIGVTTSQQMLQSELDIARWNLYEHIADLFAQEFCIMVY